MGKYRDPDYRKKYYRRHRERWNSSGVYQPIGRPKQSLEDKEWSREWACVQKRLYRHGITIDQLHSMYESQDFLCAVCGEEKRLDIDHNHVTGKFRGLLCNQCNQTLGLMQESPDRLRLAATYLENNAHAYPAL